MKRRSQQVPRLRPVAARVGRLALTGALTVALVPGVALAGEALQGNTATGSAATNITPAAALGEENALFAFDSSMLAAGDYTYLYAALSYVDYYANEGVHNGGSAASSSDPDYDGADRTEYDRGAFDAVSRATTNHGLHRGNYQGDVTIIDTEGNTYVMDHWEGKTTIVLADGTSVDFSRGAITKPDGSTATMQSYEVTGIKYVPVAVPTANLAAFKAAYRTVDNGGTLAGGYGEGVLEAYTHTAAVDATTNGLKIARANADGTFSFSQRNGAGTGSGLGDAGLQSIAAEARGAGKSVEDYLGLAVQKTSTYGDFLRVDFKSNYGPLGGAMQAAVWEYYGSSASTDGEPLAVYGTKFAADNWMHKSNGIQLGLTDSLRHELPQGTTGVGTWKVTVYALGYEDTTVTFTVDASDLHGDLTPCTEDDLAAFGELIDGMRGYQQDAYTPSSWELFAAELEEAQANLAAFKAGVTTLDAVVEAYNDLTGAPALLVERTLIDAAQVRLGRASVTYTGKAQQVPLTVTLDGTTLTEGTDYTVTYADNVNAGTARVTVTGVGDYTGSVQATFTITRAAQKLTVKKAGKRYKVSTLKKAKKSFALGAKAQGKVSYTLSKKAKKAGIKVSKAGKVTVKKGTKRGTYKITVRAAGTANYKAASKVVTVEVVKIVR